MSTPNSPVSICPNALLKLGAQSISDFTENTDRAKLVANIYPSIQDDMLKEHVWDFAIKRILFAPFFMNTIFWLFQLHVYLVLSQLRGHLCVALLLVKHQKVISPSHQ